jgi:hypothetical protein
MAPSFVGFSEFEFFEEEAIPVPVKRAAIVFYPDAGAGHGAALSRGAGNSGQSRGAQVDSTEICPRPRV